MNRVLPVVSVGLLVLLSGCKKEEPVTRTSLLTSTAWRMTAMTASPGIDDGTGRLVTDQYAELAPCNKDNTMRFATPNVLTYDEGRTRCTPGGHR